MSAQAAVQTQTTAKPAITPVTGSVLQRQCACGQHANGGECAECGKKREGTLQRAAIRPSLVHDVPPIVYEVLRSPGQPLDAATRAFMEPCFGYDFSGVRVHTDARASAAASALAARAFTMNSDVVFGGGQYAPQTDARRRLLSHELTHVVQQRAGVHLSGRIGQAGDAYERQADAVADQVMKEQSAEGMLQSIDRNSWAGTGQRKATGAIQLQAVLSKQTGLELPTHTITLPSDQYSGILGSAKQRAEQTSQDIERQRRLPVYDFTPDYAFYEILAHEFAYYNNLNLKYLYKADRAALSTQRISFRTMDTEPQVVPPNQPLYYQINEMKGPDQRNKTHPVAAYYLIPVNRPDAPGILVFRGTDDVKDILTDLDAKGPGAGPFRLQMSQIEDALHKLKNVTPKTVVTGHSLGGALAQLTTAAFPGLVSECVTFNSPGISNKAEKDFKDESKKVSVKPEITHYVTRGDIVSTVGETRLPGKTIMMDSDATRDLEKLYADDKQIELTDDAISLLKNTIDRLAAGILPSAWVISEAWSELVRSGGLLALTNLGNIFRTLHSQTLIPGSKAIGEKGVTQTPQKTKTTPTSEPSSEKISIREVEQARVNLGTALYTAFAKLSTTIPVIMATIGQPFGGPFSILAKQQVKPILDVLDGALQQAGGLKGFIGKLLYESK